MNAESDTSWLPKKKRDSKPVTPSLNLLQYGLHDSGNADRLIALHGANIRYCHAWKKWLMWDEQRWAPDKIEQLRRMAKLTMVRCLKEATEARNEEVAKFARGSLNAKKIEYALSMAQPELPVSPEQLDRDPWLLNFQNGTVDLRDCQLRPHRREDMLTKVVPHDYDPAALCLRWNDLLMTLMAGEQDLVDYLQSAFGYSLTGTTQEKAIFVLFGPKGTGKTTLLTAFREALGEDYGGLIQINSLMAGRESNSTQSDLADLQGLRYVMSSEPEQGQKLSPSKLKRLTQGMGKIKTRRLYENPFSFEETHHLWIDCNDRPEIPGADDATFSRLHSIPCFVRVPPEKVDRRLVAKLREEAPGILAWAVQGARRWLELGLPKPKEVSDATETWRAQCDLIEVFLAAQCERGSAFSVRAGMIYKAYKSWCDARGDEPVSGTAFGLRLTQIFTKTEDNKGSTYHGIRLQPSGAEPGTPWPGRGE